MQLENFHVAATGHSLNYLPEYIAARHGFFRERGLKVTVSVPNPWDLVLKELADGTAAAALGGVWVPSMYRGRVREYTAFAQVANRAPLALVGRGPDASTNFKLTPETMAGRNVLMKGSNGASIGLFFKMLLREAGVDPKAVDYVQDLDGKMLGELFAGGMGDFLFLDSLSARSLVARHPGEISIAFECAVDGSDIPWSVYYREAATAGEAAVLDAQERFCAGLEEGMRWVMERDAEEFRDELAEIFPAVPVNVAVELTNIFRQNNMWTMASVDRKGYERWQCGICDGGLVEKPLAYEEIVNDGPASVARKGAQ